MNNVRPTAKERVPMTTTVMPETVDGHRNSVSLLRAIHHGTAMVMTPGKAAIDKSWRVFIHTGVSAVEDAELEKGLRDVDDAILRRFVQRLAVAVKDRSDFLES